MNIIMEQISFLRWSLNLSNSEFLFCVVHLKHCGHPAAIVAKRGKKPEIESRLVSVLTLIG